MAYSGPDDIEVRLASLGTLKPTDRNKIDPRIEQGISYADALIDSRLSSRYRVPFVPVPDLIRHISADLAAAFSLDGGFSGGGEDDEPKLSQSIRARALKELESLANGGTVLSGASPPEPEPGSGSGVVPNHSRLGQRPVLESWNMYGHGSQRPPGGWGLC